MDAPSRTASDQPLLSPDFIRRLDRLELTTRRVLAGQLKGERRSRRKGQSVEFADYRNYVMGDDLRFLDWNIYARLERLLIKLFLEEVDLNVSVLVDTSASMDWGNPNKALYAKRVAAAVAYIGLVNYDRVSLYSIGGAGQRPSESPGRRTLTELRGVRGKRSVRQVIQFLEDLPVGGSASLSAAVRQFALQHQGKGLVMVISDFLDKGGYERGLKHLVARGVDLYAVHVLSPQELKPELQGDLRLRDVEDGEIAEVSIREPVLKTYGERLAAFQRGLETFCLRRGAAYVYSPTDKPFEDLVLRTLRRRGLFR